MSPLTKECLILFILFSVQMLLYCLLTLNYIAIAHLNYIGTAITDGLVASVNFFLIRKVCATGPVNIVKSTPDSWKPWAAYTSGGVVGYMLGIFISGIVR